MTLETVYYIGQTIAVIAILASLVAIYIQQRKDHKLARAEHQREILDSSSALFDNIASDPDGLDHVSQCLVGLDSASPRQQATFGLFCMRAILLVERAMYADKDGLVVDEALEAYLNIAVFFLGTPGGRQYWARTKPMFGDEVTQLLDARLAETPDTLESLYAVMPYLRVGKSEDTLEIKPDSPEPSE